jgi:hypothetical protein
MKKTVLTALGLIIGIAAAISTAGQANRDRPRPLNSSELSGEFEGKGGESFYSFTAGPGELTIAVDVKSIDGTFAMPFELLGANGADSILCCEFAQAATPGETGRTVKSVRLKRRQTIILHLTENEGVRGTFRVRLNGPVSFAEESESQARDNRVGTGNGHRGRMGMPAGGTLFLRMKDGSTKEIDLSLVRDVYVEP